MTTIERQLQKLEKRLSPAVQTDFDRQLVNRLVAGRERARAANEALGVNTPSDDQDLLPPILAGTFCGMTRAQIQIRILHRGRERNHLRCLASRKENNDA